MSRWGGGHDNEGGSGSSMICAVADLVAARTQGRCTIINKEQKPSRNSSARAVMPSTCVCGSRIVLTAG